MQVAAYAGIRARGPLGALAAYLGFGLPAFLLMLGLTWLYFEAGNLPAVMAAFTGIQAVVVAMIFHAAINFSRRYLNTLPAQLLALVSGLWLGFKGNPILILVLTCLAAILIFRKEAPPVPLKGDNGDDRTTMIAAAGFLLVLLLMIAGLYVYDKTLFDLTQVMARIDLFAFGGGYVSLPLMLHEVVEVRGWLTESRFMDGIALGQVTPGPIVMTATFVGYAVKGWIGAIVATIAVFSPSLIILTGATPFARKLTTSPVASRALRGSLISLVGLMAAVAARFAVGNDWTISSAAVAIAAFTALRLGIDIIWVVIGGAAVSVILF